MARNIQYGDGISRLGKTVDQAYTLATASKAAATLARADAAAALAAANSALTASGMAGLVAALLTETITTGEQTKQITGAGGAGDGGGDRFVKVAAAGRTVDNVRVFASADASYYWQRDNDGVIQSRWFGARGDALATTGTGSAASHLVTLPSGHKFVAGHGVALAKAGAACTLATPTGLAIVSTGVGAVTHSYRVCALTENGGHSAACTMERIFNGVLPLGRATNRNEVTWNAVSGAWGYAIYHQSNYTGNWELIGVNIRGAYPNAELTFYDYGTVWPSTRAPFFVAQTPPETAIPDSLITTVASAAAESIATSVALASEISTQDVFADDSPALQAALDALPAGGGKLHIPAGVYHLHTPLRVLDHDNVSIEGDGMGATILRYVGMGGDPTPTTTYPDGLVSVIDSNNFEISNLSLRGTPTTSGYFHKGLYVHANTTGRNYHIHHVECYDCGTEGLYCDGQVDGVWVDQCYVHDCSNPGINANCSVDPTLFNGPEGARIWITNCLLEGCYILAGGRTVVLANNVLRCSATQAATGADAINTGSSECVTVVGNIIENWFATASTSCIHLGLGDNADNARSSAVIAHNIIRNCRLANYAVGAAIYIESNIGPTSVYGNIISGCGIVGYGTPQRSIVVGGTYTGHVNIWGNTITGGTGYYGNPDGAGVVNVEGIRILASAGTSGDYDVHVGENYFGADVVEAQQYVFDALPVNPQTYRGASPPTNARLGDTWIDPAPSSPGFIGQVCVTGSTGTFAAVWSTFGPIT